jgi:hypothetical protein
MQKIISEKCKRGRGGEGVRAGDRERGRDLEQTVPVTPSVWPSSSSSTNYFSAFLSSPFFPLQLPKIR